MDPLTAGFIALLDTLPPHWKVSILAGLLGLFLGCKLITVFCPPPKPGSRLVWIYSVVNKIALNLRFAVNAYQVGRTAAMTPTPLVGEARTLIAEKLPVAREDTKP